MRFHHLLFLALGPAVLLAGCTGELSSNKVVQSSPKSDLVLKVAHATESGGDFGAAERSYKQAVGIDENAITPRIELAEFYHRHHKEAEAIATFNEALKLDPKNTLLMRDLANVYIDTGAPANALTLLNNAIAINGNDAFLYNSRGIAYDMMGNYTKARESYRTALSLDPGSALAFDANLSMSYILSGSYNEAILLLGPLSEMPDATPTIRQNLAMAYGMKGDTGMALKLSLKDMPMEQARENLKFYRMVAGKHGSKKTAAVKSLPVSVIDEVFPTEEAHVTAPPGPVAVPVRPVMMQNMEAPASAPVPLPSLPPAPPPPMPVAHKAITPTPIASVPEEPEYVPSPDVKQLPAASASTAVKKNAATVDTTSSLPTAAPSAGWVLPTPVLKPDN